MARDAIIGPMMDSNREIEIKLRFETAEAAIRGVEALGAELVTARQFEDNTLYDDADRSFKKSRRLVRLRRWGDLNLLTFKAPVQGKHRHKVREEIETGVTDAAAVQRILTEVGLAPVYRYQKYRTLYRTGELEICLDETPVGCFVELEGPPAMIDEAARKLGFAPDDYVCLTYRELHESAAAALGEEVGDMVFDASDGAGEPRKQG